MCRHVCCTCVCSFMCVMFLHMHVCLCTRVCAWEFMAALHVCLDMHVLCACRPVCTHVHVSWACVYAHVYMHYVCTCICTYVAVYFVHVWTCASCLHVEAHCLYALHVCAYPGAHMFTHVCICVYMFMAHTSTMWAQSPCHEHGTACHTALGTSPKVKS